MILHRQTMLMLILAPHHYRIIKKGCRLPNNSPMIQRKTDSSHSIKMYLYRMTRNITISIFYLYDQIKMFTFF